MTDNVRVFLSVDIDDDDLLSRIQLLQSQLDSQSARMKLVERENIHFTWRFIGDTPMKKVNAIYSELNHLELVPFDIVIGGIGSFPSIRRPRIIWVGVKHNTELVVNLKNQTDSLLAKLGYKIEKKKFIPHATIARVRAVNNHDGIFENLQSLSDETVGRMSVNGIRMTKSTLTSSGPIYETLWEVPNR
ncbi:MAG: RNA 2',3'-cyclic phosphodiesterase [Candidatus Thorarchaeota archaeon]|nr:RNA 2',3'-cyclic phosphodiesterase [Candidatus Thorarchaeota archaeon]